MKQSKSYNHTKKKEKDNRHRDKKLRKSYHPRRPPVTTEDLQAVSTFTINYLDCVVPTARSKTHKSSIIKEYFIHIGKREEKTIETYCVEAIIFPSRLNAAAMVDRGAGNKGQYLADKFRNDSASTLTITLRNVSTRN
jgi:hypothetical protein